MEPHAPGSAPLLIVLSGPSGVGKDAVLSRMKEQGRGYHFTVTATTRRRRPTERDGVDYIFHSEQTFREMIERGELIGSGRRSTATSTEYLRCRSGTRWHMGWTSS